MGTLKTKYATTDDGVHIAYQSLGHGPVDLVYVSEWVSNVELQWQEPRHSRFLRGLASIGRLISIDRRGTGLSDRITGDIPTLEASMEDVRAVMDAVGSARAVLFGVLDGACVCALFAATWPQRTAALILHGPFARGLPAKDYPWAWTEQRWQEDDERIKQSWGTDDYADEVLRYTAPTLYEDVDVRRWWAMFNRLTMSPGAALALNRMMREIDIRPVLPTIQVPTLVLHRADDAVANVDEGRAIADAVPAARFSELAGADHPPWAGDQDAVLTEVENFLTGIKDTEAAFDRTLATVMFTDVVRSTETAASLGDRSWRDVLERHHTIVRALLARYGGIEVSTAGDGFFSTFDGPARAVRCAQDIVDAVSRIGIEVRIGIHTGEVDTIDGQVGGLAVNVGARVAALAAPSEVLASQTVKDLVAGSGIVFEEAGAHELKGVPDRWRLYRVAR